MGFLSRLLGSGRRGAKGRRTGSRTRAFSAQDIQVIGESASRLVDVVNESLEIAKRTKDSGTRLARLNLASSNLLRLQEMTRSYPFLVLRELDAVEAEIRTLLASTREGYQETANQNMKGKALEDQGDIEEAVNVYEQLAAQSVDTPFTYRRLAILYRKKRDEAAELRALELGLRNVPPSNVTHYEWLKNRRDKLLAKSGR